MMAVEGITASASVVQTDTASSTAQDRVSELVRLERDVQKLKSHYKDKASKNGMSQIEINAKIRKYEKLIAKIEEEIRQIKRKESSRPVELRKGQEKKGNGSKKGSDTSIPSVAALKASYRMLPSAAVSPTPDISQDDSYDLKATAGNNIDKLI